MWWRERVKKLGIWRWSKQGLIVACFVLSCMQVCTKAAEPGNPNRRRNTSILLRHATPSGTTNIVVDAGKYVLWMGTTTRFASFLHWPVYILLRFFYHSALQWFPTFGCCLWSDLIQYSVCLGAKLVMQSVSSYFSVWGRSMVSLLPILMLMPLEVCNLCYFLVLL